MTILKKISTIFRRVALLLWKNILFRRKFLMIVLTVIEILAPTFLVGGLAWYRTIVDNDTGIKETNFTYFSTYPEEDLLRPAKRKLNMKNTFFAYYPDNVLTREIMEMVKLRIGTRAELKPFDSEEELEVFVEDSEIPLADYKIRKNKIGAAIIFGPAFQVPNETLYLYNPLKPEDHRLNYTIRIPLYTIDTSHLVGSLQLPGPQHDNAQSYRGAAFLGIQIALDKSIINFLTGEEPPAGELMKIHGLPNWMHWFGWMINTLLVLVVSISIVIFFLFYPLDETKGGIVTDGDITVWWFLMFLYVMAATSFCFFISVFTTNPVMATTVGIVLWLLSYFLVAVPLALDYENLTLVKKLVSSILPNTALHWSLGIMATLEGKGIGAQWWNIAQPGSTLDGTSLLHMILVLIFDTIFYISFSMYFENVLPSKYGIRKPWYYPLMNLTKQYGKKTAVNGVSLNMYHGQITALVGHNGAGKTTTLSILTGLFPPTSGSATVNGFDITDELDSVRENLGLCPQHNMLFDDLTVLEHLQFFGRLKGLTSFEAHYEAVSLIKKLQLKSKKHVAACNLSGGQKRKLSLGIALVGGSKVVILDEPTSGMDPEARRVIWDLLLAMRGERTLVLTTHFMEEADILGDRIAVMARGKVSCVGTPLYLKKYFGAGYILKLTAETQTEKENQSSAILDAVKTHVQDAYQMKEEKAGHNFVEISISIPCSDTTGPKLPPLFKDLDANKEKLGIQTIGLSLSTIEDVFLAIEENNCQDGEETATTANNHDSEKKNGHVHSENQSQARYPSLFKQVYGLLMKKTVYTLRKKKILAGQFLMPPIMIIVAILIFNTFYVPRENYPTRVISLDQYKDPIVLYKTDDDVHAEQFKEVVGPNTNAIRVTNETIMKALERAAEGDLGNLP
ncbi:ATP-binding cassette sub-family A member 3 [Orchesella cincta]|uniref:ATP-binding cassette sub-family A member 3 n=1 Tax=Orchesella cincta TaxID=48709 RepID=A0A1D2NFG7_ORCCI|nr:ATP-binding cassette sub-family A member 3 [Orchesella cincta]